MDRATGLGALACMLGLLIVAPTVSAGGFISKKFGGCPATGLTILPPGGRTNITDIVISSNSNQEVTIKFAPGGRIMGAFVAANDTVVANFSEQIESDEEQAIKMDCAGGQATVTVTIVGNSSF